VGFPLKEYLQFIPGQKFGLAVSTVKGCYSTVLLKVIQTYRYRKSFRDERIIFHNINFVFLSFSALDSFRLIKVILYEFYGIFSGP
jgi:hypothetical protein